MKKTHLILLTGPTASGKTDLAIRIAEHFGTEVVSADSRQIYKEMRIGTARPEKNDWKGVPHHLLGHKSITEPYDVSDYEQEALAQLEIIFLKHKIAVVCGGTGLYIRALCEGLDEMPEIPEDVRRELRKKLEQEGIAFLQEYLQINDPESYSRLDLQNPHRLLRAVETHMATGIPLSAFKTGKKATRPFHIIKIGLDLPQPVLHERINMRVDTMMEQGLVEEVKKLLPYRHLQALQTVGYTELFDYFDGKSTLEDAVELIKRNTRRYAKRQLTWLRKDKDITWFSPGQDGDIIRFIEQQMADSSHLGAVTIGH